MQKSNEKRITGEYLILLILLGGIYIFPEKIKYFSLLFICVILFMSFFKHWRFKIDYNVLAFTIYIFISIIGGLSQNVTLSNLIEFDASILMGIMVYGFWIPEEKREKHVDALITLGYVVIFGCILQLTNIGLLQQINRVTLGPDKYSIFDMFSRGKFMVGFSFQTGVTGFYLAVISLCFIVFYLEEKESIFKKYLYLVCCGACVVLTFLTGKRIFILLEGLIILALVCVYYKKNFLKILGASILLIFALYFLLMYTEYGKSILLKMNKIDPTTGRNRIYAKMINWFWRSPVFGNGITSTLTLLDGYQNGHNIYLQILCESGVIGFLLIVPVFLINLFKSIKTFIQLKTQKLDAKYYAICLTIQILFIGWGLTGNPLYDVYPFIIYMVAIGYINAFGY